MKKSDVIQAWSRILGGRPPSLSIEITKECPLQCPGCYAFDAAHLGGTTQPRQLSDFLLETNPHRECLHLSMNINQFTCRLSVVIR